MPEYSLIPRSERPWYLRYGSSIAVVAVALALTWLFPALRSGTPFMLFFVAITLSALFGGYRAGLLTILLSCLAVEIWVMPPVGHLVVAQEQWVQLLAFVIVANLIVWLVHRANRARRLIDAQRESLRITLASIGDAVISTDDRGQVVRMNAVASHLTGWPVQEALGRPLDEIFHIVNEKTGGPAENPVARVLAEGRVVALADQSVLIARDGTSHPIENSAAPIQDAGGHTTGVVLIFHDVSERRAREQALAATERRLRMALDAGHMMAWEWDIYADKIWTTDSARDVYGVAAFDDPAVGMGLIHADDIGHHQGVVDRTVANGGGYHTEFRVVRPDTGATVWIEEWATAIVDPAGKVEKLAGVAMDVTARKEAEDEIRRLNSELDRRVQELQAIFDLALVGIAVAADPACEVVIRNQTLAQWIDVPKGMGPSLGSTAAPPLPFHLRRNGVKVAPDELPMQRAIAEGRSIVNDELEIVREDGFRLAVLVSATPLFDEEGNVTGCVGAFTDVTERKAAEVSLQNLNLILEQRVATRTAELQEMNRELVEFTNTVSHDLRAPLRAVMTLSEWIAEETGSALPPAAQDHLTKMRQRAERMEKMLTDLSAYTRAGRVHYPTERVNLAVLTRDTINLLDAPVGFTATVVEPMLVLMTERIPLETVLRNVIGNAIKHHHNPTEGHVTIAVRELDTHYEFTVTDDGPGIAPEFHPRIFKVFQTLRPRDEVEGSGMGLAIAQRLVVGRGGAIKIESQVGAGVTLYFTWPK